MNGEFRNGEVFPNPEEEDVKSPRGGDDIVLVDRTQAFAKNLNVDTLGVGKEGLGFVNLGD
jgi:hypothetical protein